MKNKGVFCAFIAVALCSLVGCNQKKTAKKEKTESTSVVHEDDDSKIRQIFSMYRESGGTLSYEEWLRTIKGEKGDPGQNGEDGNDGSTILSGTGAPTNSQGKAGDYYINTLNWDFYKKGTANWALIGNLKGADGEPGSAGKDGENGLPGANGKDGTSVRTGEGYPSLEIGNNGDSYINLLNWDYYVKEGGYWVLKGNIKGTGVSVTSTVINDDGDLIIEFSNGETTNAGHLVDTDVYQVRFHVDDEIVATRNVLSGQKVDRPTKEETAGYTIDRWYSSDIYKETWNFDGCVVTSNLELWAEFTYNEYEVTFIDQTYGNETQTLTVQYDNPYSFPEFTHVGYSVIKWKDADGNEYKNKAYRHVGDVSLYAEWAPNSYTIWLNADGGTVSDSEVNATYNEPYTLPTPEKTGYVFIGWYEDETRISSDAIWLYTTDKSLTAKWTNVSMTFSFDPGNGACDTESMVILYGENYVLPYPTYEGHYFVGWQVGDVLIPREGVWTYSAVGCVLTALWSSDNGELVSLSKDKKLITYGLYPQSVVSNPNLQNELNKLDNPDEKGWYEYEGHYYTKISATPYSNDMTFSNGASIVKGNEYWFLCEAIHWYAFLINNQYYCFSETMLDTHRYNNTRGSVVIDGDSYYANNYKYSEIRSWLNNDFYNCAFSLSDDAVQTIEVDNSPDTTGRSNNQYACENTFDKVFLPSKVEFDNYCASRGHTMSDWAKARGLERLTSTHPNVAKCTLTRSPYYDYSYMSYVIQYEINSNNATEIFSGSHYAYTNRTGVCVLPSISVKLY